MSDTDKSGTYRYCPDCGFTDIRREDSHGDTVCYGCGWYTEQGGPNDPVDWESINDTPNTEKDV